VGTINFLFVRKSANIFIYLEAQRMRIERNTSSWSLFASGLNPALSPANFYQMVLYQREEREEILATIMGKGGGGGVEGVRRQLRRRGHEQSLLSYSCSMV
jgi:hypothetical protein